MGHSEVDPAFKSAESAAELLGSRKHTGRDGIGGGCFPGRDLDPERSGCMRHCHVTVHGGRLLAFGQLKRVTLQQVAEEEEHLGLRQVVAQAHASTDREGHEVVWLVDPSVHEEALRSEFFGVFPQVRVHVDGPEVRDNMSVRRNTKARQLHITGCGVGVSECYDVGAT